MKPTGPKVSVVVVTYNQEDTIARAIESVLMQQCSFGFEILIADDCSTDGTSGICRRYASLYPGIIRYHRNESNKGVRDNYFDALLRCEGIYIADCAGDDWWTDPRKLQKQADILDARPDVGLVHTNWEYAHTATGAISPSPHNSRPLPASTVIFTPDEIFLPTLRHAEHPFIHLCSALYRKTVFDKAHADDPSLFRSPEFPCEDLQLKVLYAREMSVAYIPDVTMRYSVGHRSVSSTESHTKTFDFYSGSLALTIRLAKKYGIDNSQLAGTYASLASYLFSEAYFAIDKDRISRLRALLAANGIPLPPKSRMLLPTTACRPLWKSCAALKAFIARHITHPAD